MCLFSEMLAELTLYELREETVKRRRRNIIDLFDIESRVLMRLKGRKKIEFFQLNAQQQH